MANAGAATGSTPPVTPTPTASRRTKRATCGSTAIGSIEALNRDLPYDRFIIEQLAGDQLPRDQSPGEQSDAAAQDRIVATGFLRNSMLNEEGGIDPEQFRMEAMFDRMDCIGKSVLGLTIQCCQCHNHKYDPITQEEYYRLFAFLNNDHAPQRVVYTPDELMKRESLVRQIREIEADLRHRAPDWQDKMAQWEQQAAANQPPWEVLAPDDYEETGGGAKLSLLKDQSMLCAGYAPTHCTFRVVAKTKLARVTALRLEMLVDPNLPRGGPGRSFKGTFGLSEIKIEAAPADAPDKNKNTDKTTEIKIASATADYSQAEVPLDAAFDDRSGKKRVLGPVAFAIDGKTETAWGIDSDPGRTNQDRKAVFQLAAPIEFPAGAIIKVSLVQNHGGWNSDDHQNNLLGRFRVSVTSAPAPVVADPLPKRVREILAIPSEKRSPAQTDTLFSVWRAGVPEWREANDKIESLMARVADRRDDAGARIARRAARDQRAEARRFPAARQSGDGGRAGDAASFARRRSADAALAGALVGGPPQPHDGPRVCEPRVAGVLWHGHRGHERGFWHAERAAFAPGTAGLVGLRAHGPRLEHQGAAPADRQLGRRIGSRRRSRRSCLRAIRSTGCWRAGRGSASRGKWCATWRCRPAGC